MLNVDKTTYLYFGHKKFSQFNISILEQPILRCSSTKLLGLYIDDKFNWKPHIVHLKSLITPWKHIFYNLRDKLSVPSKYLLYSSFIQSHLRFCIELYSNSPTSYLQGIKILQNRLLKILFNFDKFFPSDQLYKQLKVLSFNNLATQNKLRIAYLTLYKEISYFPKENIKLSLHDRNGPLFILYHSSLGSHDVIAKVFTCWNNLPPKIRSQASTVSLSFFLHSITSQNP